MTTSGRSRSNFFASAAASVTSSSARPKPTTSWPALPAASITSRPSIPAAPVTRSFIDAAPTRRFRSRSCRRPAAAASSAAPSLRVSLTLRPSRLASIRVPRSSTTEPARMIECSTSERRTWTSVADRGVGADVGVLDAGAGADHGRAADDRAGQRRARLDDDPALDPRLLVDLALEPRLDLLEHEAVGLEHVGELAGVLPPAADDLRLDPVAVVDQAPGSPR